MGNSPSMSVDMDSQRREEQQEELAGEGQGAAQPLAGFNPFDDPRRLNFPELGAALHWERSEGGSGSGADSGPSIDTLAALYPIDFPLRQGHMPYQAHAPSSMPWAVQQQRQQLRGLPHGRGYTELRCMPAILHTGKPLLARVRMREQRPRCRPQMTGGLRSRR